MLMLVNSADSETFDVIGAGLFKISYQDNSTSVGDYFTDVLEIGSARLDNFTMGLGQETTVPFGLIGVGYDTNEASNDNSDIVYPNLPVALQKRGVINSVAYSLWLNDLDASTGSILFGGVDTDKFVGNLMSIPLLSEGRGGTISSFLVSLYSLEATSSSGSDILASSESSIEAILDSGTTLTYLPQDLARQAWDEVGAVYDADFQSPVLPCSYRGHKGQFSFRFANAEGPRVNVSMDELVLDISDSQQQFQFSSGPYRGQEVCAFGIQNSSDTPYLLGDTFLRSAYVVYDLVNNEVGIAATNFNSNSSNKVAFASSGAKIPFATQVPSSNSSTTGPSSSQASLTASQGFQGDNGGLGKHVPLLLLLGTNGIVLGCLLR